MAESKNHYYEHYTWPEIREVVKQQPVVVLPVGSVEDHGWHLPLDVDNFLIGSICEEAARRMDGEMLLLPPVSYGFEEHHMDFPGTIDISMEHLLHFVLDITRSVAHHGFNRILLADGHGSNMPILDLVARRTVLETEALCGAFIWPSLARDVIEEVRESEKPGGMAHACELETSVYLYLDDSRVRMDEAEKEIGLPPSRFIWMDLMDFTCLFDGPLDAFQQERSRGRSNSCYQREGKENLRGGCSVADSPGEGVQKLSSRRASRHAWVDRDRGGKAQLRAGAGSIFSLPGRALPMSILMKQKSLCWILSALLCLIYVGAARSGWAVQAADVTLVVDTSHSAGKIDLTRYALGQGGFTYRPMIGGVIPQVAQLHPQTIRLFVQEYFNLYPDHGHYQWETLDRAIDAILATGAKPIMNLCFKPKILFPRIDERLVRPTSWAEWDRLIFRLVKHCNDGKKYGIEYWEITNEPNIPDGGGTPYNFTPQEYLNFYTHTANAIRRADSSAKVGGPALATWDGGPLLGSKSPILDSLIDYCGTGRAPLDFISWHLYDNRPELFRKEIMEVREKLAEYASLTNVETILDEWNLSLGNPDVNPAYQPAFIIENTYGFYKAGLSRSGYYQIKDEFFDAKLFSTFMPGGAIPPQEHFFNVLPVYLGLYDLQGRVRPSYYAFKLLSSIKGERLSVKGASGGVKVLAARNENFIDVIFWNFPENEAGRTLGVTVQFPNRNAGRFHLTWLDAESAVNNLKTLRSGSLRDLTQNPLRVAVRPYEIYWVEISQ